MLYRQIKLDDLHTSPYNIFSHQNKDIVRLSPEELKTMMAAKEALNETNTLVSLGSDDK